jgi:tetratricopeptide (TPR) repeat protein
MTPANNSGSPALQPAGAKPDAAAIQTNPPQPSSTAVQTAAAATDRVALPQPPAAPRVVDPEKARIRALVVDGIQVALVLVLAGFSAAFPIRNSDVFMHMGTAKLLLDGKYTFGTDPFSVNPPDSPWVNQSWLFDLVTYGLFRAGGAEALVVFKALTVLGLVGFMLAIRRKGQPLWIPALCTGLAALSFSTRLLYQPQFLSFFFLALTVFILSLRGTRSPTMGRNQEKPSFLDAFAAWPYRLFALPVLFALWANVDAWFILGPLTVALYLIGEMLQDALNPLPRGLDSPEPGEQRRLVLVLGLSVAACLVNPHHYHVFRIPDALSSSLSAGIKQDRLLRNLFWSPWQSEYFASSSLTHSLAVMAYYPLLALGFLSFVVNVSGWRWWRGLVWAAFAALAAYHARSIPFFAIIAAPIMVLNFQDAVSAWGMGKNQLLTRPNPWFFAGRLLSVLVLTLLVAGAWAGWTHGLPGDYYAEHRRVGWGLDVDPALVETAEKLAKWREDLKIRDDQNVFNVHPDAANFLAYYCPEAKSFFDYRLGLFADTAEPFFQMRDELNPPAFPGAQRPDRPAREAVDWRAVFRRRHIRFVLFYDLDHPFTGVERIERLLAEQAQERRTKNDGPESEKRGPADRPEWTLAAQRGRATLYAWNDPDKTEGDAFPSPIHDFGQRAFGSNGDPAPAQSAGRGPTSIDDSDAFPELREYWEKFATKRPSRTPDSYETQFHLMVGAIEANQKRGDRYYRAVKELAAAVGSVVGMAVKPGHTINANIGNLHNAIYTVPNTGFDAPASTLLAIRAARRALAANPADDNAYTGLANAYLRSPEVSNSNSLIGEIRRCQIAGCLYNSLKVNPDQAEAQVKLAQLYGDRGFADLSLKHFKEWLRLTREAGPPPGVAEEIFKVQIRQMTDQVKDMEGRIKDAQNDYLIGSKDMPKVLRKARMALERRLGGEAVELLLRTSRLELGDEGEILQIRLLLEMGRAEELGPAFKKEETTPNSFLVIQAMTVGDYDRADNALRQMIARAEDEQRAVATETIKEGVKEYLRFNFLDSAGLRPLPWLAAERTGLRPVPLPAGGNAFVYFFIQQLKQVSLVSPTAVEWTVLRGLIALEIGNTKKATDLFRTAINTAWPPRRYVAYLSVLGTTSPLAAAASLALDLDAVQGPMVGLPSRWLALEYLRLLEREAAK